MKNEPLVSIIMNCHNSDKFLKAALDSVYNQSYQNWEIIFWDNNSIDSSSKIAKSYDSKLKYFKSEEFTNLGEARRRACKQACGKYLAFLDCDDLWDHNKLKLQIKLFEKSKDILGLVYGKTVYYSEKKQKNIKKHQPNYSGNIFYKLINYNFVSFASAVILREKYIEIGGFPNHLQHSTDYWIFLKLAKKYPFKTINTECCVHRLHENNLTKRFYITGVKESIEVLKLFLPNKKVKYAIQRNYGRICFNYLLQKEFKQFVLILFEKKLLFVLLHMIIEKMYSIIFNR